MFDWGIFRDLIPLVGNNVRRSAKTAACVVVCSVAPALTLANQAPVVDSFVASPTSVVPGGTVTFSVTATDPDCTGNCTSGCGLYIRGDLTSWSATGGTFLAEDNGTNSSPYMATATWQAPTVENVYTVEVTLADSGTSMCGDRQTTTASVLILVTSTPNQAPVVEEVTADPDRMFPSETAHLRCFASDPDGDPLTYSWSTDFGTLVPGTGATAEFTSDVPGVATVTCMATDVLGAPGIGSVVVSVSDVTAERAMTDGLASPQRVAVDSTGSLYAVDRSAGGIAVLRLEDGRLMYRIPAADVTAIAVDWADRLLVGTSQGATVLGRDGTVIRRLGFGPAVTSDVAVDLGRQHYVILQRHTGRVVVCDETGTIVADLGSTGDGPDQLRSPSGVAVLPDGRIVVADSGHGVLKVFNLDGTLSLTIGSSGNGAGEFVELDDVAVDSRGVIWASDSFQDWVQSFGADGSLREIVGTYGDGVGRFKTAAGIAVAESFGSLVVASVNSSAVQVFQLGSPVPVEWPIGEASTSPHSLLFSVQAVGTTSPPLGLDLFNTGNGPLGVSGFEVTGPFAVSGGCNVVDPGGGCTFDVVFRPPYSGTHVGELVLHTSADPEPLRVPLNGLGFVPAQLAVDRSRLDFPPQGVGTTSAARTIVLTNLGTVPLSLAQITVDGPFGLTSHCGGELAGGSSCTLWVDFSPTIQGSVTGALMIQSDAAGSPRRIPLSGTGEVLELKPQPGSITFGSVRPGMSSPTEQIQVLNTGTASVTIEEVTLGGADPDVFEIVTDQCSGNQVDEGQSCWLQVRFTPTDYGSRSAQLAIPITEGFQFMVELSGGEVSLFADGFESGDTSAWSNGVPGKSIRVTPIVVDFGEVDFGTDTEMRIVTVTNGSDGPVWLGRLQVIGDHAMEFVIYEDYCSSAWLENGDSCWFTVNLLTLDEGSFTALVEIPAPTVEDSPPDPVRLEGAVWLP